MRDQDRVHQLRDDASDPSLRRELTTESVRHADRTPGGERFAQHRPWAKLMAVAAGLVAVGIAVPLLWTAGQNGSPQLPAAPRSGPVPGVPDDAVLFIFTVEDARDYPTAVDTGSLDLSSATVPDLPALARTPTSTWALAGAVGEAPEMHQDSVDAILAATDTTLSVDYAWPSPDPVISLRLDDERCAAWTAQPLAQVGADGSLADNDWGTDDQGCTDPGQAAEEAWAPLLADTWLHQLGDDVVVVSVVFPGSTAASTVRSEAAPRILGGE